MAVHLMFFCQFLGENGEGREGLSTDPAVMDHDDPLAEREERSVAAGDGEAAMGA